MVLLRTSKTAWAQGPVMVGPMGSDVHDALVREIDEQERYYARTLEPIWDDMNEMHRLYYGDIPDERQEHEMWRANIHVPKPHSAIETSTANTWDILCSGNPMIQVVGRGDEDYEDGRGCERLLEHTLSANKFVENMAAPMIRAALIQGLTFLKTTWREDMIRMMIHGNKPEMVREFTLRVREAKM